MKTPKAPGSELERFINLPLDERLKAVREMPAESRAMTRADELQEGRLRVSRMVRDPSKRAAMLEQIDKELAALKR